MKNITVDDLFLESDLKAACSEVSLFAPTARGFIRDEVRFDTAPMLARLLLSMNSAPFIGKLREVTGIPDLTLGTSYLARYNASPDITGRSKSQGGRYGRLPVECELILSGSGKLFVTCDEKTEIIDLLPGRLFLTIRETAVSYRREVIQPMASALVEYSSKSWKPKSLPGARRGMILDAALGF